MDLRYGWRALRRVPGFSLLVIGTLALGIGATTTMFSAVWAVFLRPLPLPDADRLVTVWQIDPRTGERLRIVPADFADWQAQSRSFEALGVLPNWTGEPWTFNVGSAERVERVEGIYASSGFFRTIGVSPLLGRALAEDDDRVRGRRSVVISHGYWQRRFAGAADVIGRAIEIDTFRGGAFTVVGVMPPGYDLPRGADLWLSLADWGGGPMPLAGAPERCCAWYTVVGRLRPGASIASARDELRGMAQAPALQIVPLREFVAGGDTATITGLVAAVACVLLIACANVANLLLSRGISRRSEVATRLALGATRSRLARQLLAESGILAAIGMGIGLLASLWAQALVKSAFGERQPYLADMRIDWVVLGFCLLLSVAVTVVCGLVPLVDWARAGFHARSQTESPGSRRMRHALVVAEIATAIVVTGTAGLLVKTVTNLRSVDVGFERSRTVVVRTDLTTSPLRERGAAAQFVQAAVERFGSLPGVAAAAATTGVPFEGGPAAQPITREGDPARSQNESPRVVQTAVTPEYFRAMSIAVLRGRGFTPDDRADGTLVALINQTAARRYWPGEDPIGKRFAVGSRERFGSFRAVRPGQIEWRQIVGVVSDIRTAGYASEVQPEVFYSSQQFPLYDPSFVIRTTAAPSPSVTAIRAVLESVNGRAVVVRVRTLEEIAERSIGNPRLRASTATVFSVVALILGMLGIYGLMSYTVSQQFREIGLRVALGAGRADVSRLVIGKALRLTAAGAALGVVCTYLVARWISSLFFGVAPGDPLVLGGACLALLVAALIAATGPARRALSVDPAVALRRE